MKDFSSILLSWYAIHKRALPWREVKDPYLIWISEIILQQTRVAQGYDYFLRFVKRFPNVQSLAEASQDEVLKYWEGLGYYSRARNLHEAARSMNGVFPSSYPEVLALKGVGEYTAAAICSFAYQMPYAVVDGNVYRVLARIFGIDTPADTAAGKKCFHDLAQKLLDIRRPDDYNQAIMDFGALQCVPGQPDCKKCPFSRRCVAYKTGRVSQLPVRKDKTSISNRFFSYIYVKQGRCTWLHRREKQDIWRGLYEFPLIETDGPVTLEQLKKNPLWQKYFSSCTPCLLCGPVKHVLSHRVIYAWFYLVTVPRSFPVPEGFSPVAQQNLKEYAFPRLLQKILSQQDLCR